MIITLHYFNDIDYEEVYRSGPYGYVLRDNAGSGSQDRNNTADDSVRYVVAAPSTLVCSKQIDIQIKDGVILSVKYTRGCDGNAKGIGALIAGMTVEEAIKRLEGITCGKRPTSCPDQLAKVLKSLK